MRQQISQVIQNALLGSGKVNITFKPEATSYIYRLLYLNRIRAISLNNGDALLLKAIAECGYWNREEKRAFTITLVNKSIENLFIDQLHQAIEKIEVVN